MAATQAELGALAAAHQAAQTRISAETAAVMLRLWPVLVADGPDSPERWLALVMQVMRTKRLQSAQLAGGFSVAYRQLNLGIAGPTFTPTIAGALNEEAAIRSMMVMGPQKMRAQLIKARTLESRTGSSETAEPSPSAPRIPARKLVLINEGVAAAAVRHVRNGERDTIDNVVREDARCIGYQRVSDGNPCFWCGMLISRGPVYKSDSFEDSDPRFTGPGDHKVHDGCGCGLVPLYTREGSPTDEWKRFEDQWVQMLEVRKPGESMVLAFRRLYEGRHESSSV